MILIDQPVLRKLGSDAQTACQNVLSRLLPECEDLFHRIRMRDSRVGFPDLFQCRREDDLGERVEHAGELIDRLCLRLVPGDVGPVGDHKLIRGPAIQDEIRPAQHAGEVRVQFVIGNPVRVAGVPVGRNIDRKNYPSHRPPYMTLNDRLRHRLIMVPDTG